MSSLGDIDVASSDASYVGESAADLTGFGLGIPGDLDGDGYDDVLLGVPEYDGARPGAVYIDYGSVGRRAGETSIADLVRLPGAAPSDATGSGIAAAGDTDGDGFPDFLVGAPNSGNGRIYRVSGRSTRFTSGDELAAIAQVWDGEADHPDVGYTLAGGYDVDGDGLADTAAVAPYAERAYLVLGGSTGSGPLVDFADAVLDSTHAPGCVWDSAISLGPDVDGDGLDDMALGGSCDADDLGTSWLVPGAVSWSGSASDYDAVASFVVTGSAPQDYCGVMTALVGDVDGDSQGDLAIGCPYLGSVEDGAVYLFSGAVAAGTTTTATASAARAGSAGEGAGAAFSAMAGDVNGDGFAEILTGTRKSPGVAYLLYGGP